MIKLALDIYAGLLDKGPVWVLIISKLRFHRMPLFGLGRAGLQTALSFLVSSTAPPFPPSSAECLSSLVQLPSVYSSPLSLLFLTP